MHDHDGMNKVFALPILFKGACVCVWVCVCVSILPDPLLTLLQQPAMLARSNGAEIKVMTKQTNVITTTEMTNKQNNTASCDGMIAAQTVVVM